VDAASAERDGSRTGLEGQGLIAPASDDGPFDTPEVRDPDHQDRLVPQDVLERDLPDSQVRAFELSFPLQPDVIERDLVDAPVSDLRPHIALDAEGRGKKPRVTHVGHDLTVHPHGSIAVGDRQDGTHQRLLGAPLLGYLALNYESSRLPLPHQHTDHRERNQKQQDENADHRRPCNG